MRILEITLLIVITILPFVKRLLLRKTQKKYMLSFILILTFLHLSIDGWRWQMLPAYLLIIIVIWRIYRINIEVNSKPSFIGIFGYAIVILTLIPMWSLPFILAVFSLPESTGKYDVGSKWMHIQTDREELITKDSLDKRELMVKVWYPTKDVFDIKKEKYIDEANRIGFVKKYSMGVLPPFTINYLDRIETDVYRDAPIGKKTFPVLIFSPGYGSMSTGYYSLLTEITSHGYIIINVTHTYESLGATFPDGEMKFFDYEYLSREDASSMKHIAPIKNAFTKDISFDERHRIIRESSKGYFATKIIKRWSNDLIAVMDTLENWNDKGFFKDRMDLNKIGVFGHSRGGGAAGQAMIKDNRIKAAANIDGIQWGEMMDTIYQKPFLHISSDWPADHQDINSHVYINKSNDYFYESKLLKSGHPNFMDIPLMIPIKSLAGTGAIDAKLGLKITNELLLEFFDKHLKNKTKSDPFIVSNRYTLLEMNVYKGDSIQ
ncbi:alpha/beta hydrolase family protein [Aquimarina sp. M1]